MFAIFLCGKSRQKGFCVLLRFYLYMLIGFLVFRGQRQGGSPSYMIYDILSENNFKKVIKGSLKQDEKSIVFEKNS